MRGCRMLAIFIALSLTLIIPPVSADDDAASAKGLVNGLTDSGYVCSTDGCSPTDETDWWKIYAYKGDIVQIGFSGSMNNPAWWCPGDGWEADYSMHDSSTNQISSLVVSDAKPTDTLSTTMPTAGYVYVKIKGKNTWCNDGFDYTLNPSINQADRDTDEDGFIDTDDDCDLVQGTSTNDRKGCPDQDLDGWSDPDSGWGPNNGADAFPSESSQWLDSDNDGYGDNIDGFEPDHCPFSRGYYEFDRYGCLDSLIGLETAKVEPSSLIFMLKGSLVKGQKKLTESGI